MKTYLFTAVAPVICDKYNLWDAMVMHLGSSGETVRDAYKAISMHTAMQNAYEWYAFETTGAMTDVQCNLGYKIPRRQLIEWLKANCTEQALAASGEGPESFSEYDSRRYSESHLEKKVINDRPLIHLAMDLLDNIDAGTKMDLATKDMSKKQMDILAKAFGRILPLKTVDLQHMNARDFKQIIMNITK